MISISSVFTRKSEDQFIARNEFMRWAVLFIVFLASLGIRIVGITRIPLDYHPVKQYRAALTARAFYYSRLENIPEWEKDIAASSLERIGILGPPVAAYIGSIIYSITGSEELWIAKLLSVIYWMIGGIFLYQIARRMMSEDAAIVSICIFLFLPFGVVSSQSFQPDPLMLMFTIISIYTITMHYEQSTKVSIYWAGLATAIAILVKPVCAFIIFGGFIALQYQKKGFNKDLIFDRDMYIFIFTATFPALLYYGYGIFYTETLNQQAQKSFIPQLFLQFNFWDGWLKRIKLAVGFTTFVGGILGVFLYPVSWQKKLLVGLWIGYFVMCFAFNYTISTHDYYHLPLFLIITLSLGSIADVLIRNLNHRANNRWQELSIAAVLFIALFLSAGTNVQATRKLPNFQPEIETEEEIGNVVSHSARTIFLAPYDGKPLMYYGKISGQYWPYWYDIRDEKLWGVKEMTPQQRFSSLSIGIDPEYFIVTDLVEFENQSDLKQFLDDNFPILFKNLRYIIYQLSTNL